MNCDFCNGIVQEKKAPYSFKSKVLGDISVPSVTFKECQGCGDRLVPPESAIALHKYIAAKEQEEIRKLPSSDLITADEAAEILGVTKQAFSKNPKIKRGFVYHITIGRRKVYFKKSVQRFKENGDGRYLLKPSWGKLTIIHGGKKQKTTTGHWETELSSPQRPHRQQSKVANGNQDGYTVGA